VVVTLQATKLALWMALKRPLFKEIAAPLDPETPKLTICQ
jgi:hypothetical protein